MDNNQNIPAKKNTSDVLFLLGVLIFLLLFVLIVGPTKTISHDVEVAFTDTETYYEKEPYEVQEKYQVQEPYSTVEYYTDTVPVQVSVPYIDTEYYYQAYDASSGKYYATISSGCSCSMRKYGFDASGNIGYLCIQQTCLLSRSVTKYRMETQQQTIQKERPVTKYRDVTKYRTVIEYRDVERTREVMKTRIEPQLLEVNWLLGFKSPYKLHLPIISGD